MPRLIFEDPQSGQEVSVDIGPELSNVTIGRSPGNVVRINQPSVSREHAEIAYDDGQCAIRDLDSSNGTYINGTPVQNQVLRDGDRIQVGDFPLDYVEPWEESEQAAGEGAGRVGDAPSAGALDGEPSAASGGGQPHTETARGTGSAGGFAPGQREGHQPDFAEASSGQQQDVTRGPDGPMPIGNQQGGTSTPPESSNADRRAPPSEGQEFQESLDADDLFEGEIIDESDIESLDEAEPQQNLEGEEVAVLREENAELRERVAELEADQRKKKEIFEELSGDLRELVNDKSKLKARLEKRDRELREMFEGDKGELREKYRDAVRERDELRERVDELEAYLEESAGGSPAEAELTARVEELESELAECEQTLEEVVRERDQLEDELADC